MLEQLTEEGVRDENDFATQPANFVYGNAYIWGEESHGTLESDPNPS